ncbi:MAG: hypothetical protein MUP27_02130 [Desulfobacterales bacterium]|jgi:hypothetical protein|nr:hypothetical protein [Desulfobacterales bacterium]
MAMDDGVHGENCDLLRRRMKWELGKVLSLPTGDDKKEWILSEDLKRLIELT